MANAHLHMDIVEETKEGRPDAFAFEWAQTATAAAATSPAIMVPKIIQNISLTVSLASGANAKVQVTTDTDDTVINGSPVWVDWTAGSVAVTTNAALFPCTAVRLINTNTTGTATLTIRAQ